MGPTGIAPGTQYFVDQPDARALPGDHGARPGRHGDHRPLRHLAPRHGQPAATRPRFMVKFEFGRMDDPARGRRGAWPAGVAGDGVPAPRWPRCGRTSTAGCAGAARAPPGPRGTADAGEPPPGARRRPCGRRTSRPACGAAYALGGAGAPAVPALADALRGGPEPLRRYAGYGLSAAGAPAVEALSELTRSPDEEAAPGRRRRPERHGPARPRRRPGRWPAPWGTRVRRCAGRRPRRWGRSARRRAGAVGALGGALRDEAPYVRFNAALALARIGPGAAGAVPALVEALDDADRYARGWAAPGPAPDRHARGHRRPARPPDDLPLVSHHHHPEPLLSRRPSPRERAPRTSRRDVRRDAGREDHHAALHRVRRRGGGDRRPGRAVGRARPADLRPGVATCCR